MDKPPKVIYLIPEDADEHAVYSWVWCDDPAPGVDMDEADAVKYIRADCIDSKKLNPEDR